MQKPKCHLMRQICQYPDITTKYISPLLSDYVCLIAQYLKVLRHQSEVGVKSPWLLVIQNVVLKVIDISIKCLYKVLCIKEQKKNIYCIWLPLRALHKHFLRLISRCHLDTTIRATSTPKADLSHIVMDLGDIPKNRCKFRVLIFKLLTIMTWPFKVSFYLWDFLNEHSSPQILPKIHCVTQILVGWGGSSRCRILGAI